MKSARWALLAFPLLAFPLLASPVFAQSRDVTGQAGLLAEWDVTATVTQVAKNMWSGPLIMKHVGFCGVDGPEERSGELRLRLSDPPGDMTATLVFGGEVCAFSLHRTDQVHGVMRCSDRRDIPMMLSMP